MRDAKRIVIIGGGASGALLAWQLARQGLAPNTTLIDPSAEPGHGLAYSTPSLRHLLNVGTSGMKALPDQPDHLLAWLRAHYDPNAQGDGFAPRAVFGRYLHVLFTQSGVTHLRGEAAGFDRVSTGLEIALHDESRCPADIVVLATGHFEPAPFSGVDPDLQRKGLYHHNAWDNALYDCIASDEPVTLVGTGLTTVDVVLRLRSIGHQAVITALSRSGRLPSRHEACAPLDHPAISPDTPATACAYLRAFHQALRTGVPWRALIDSVRAQENSLWLALPDIEKRRFRRHLQRRWDVLRHRMAPAISDAIDHELATGGLVIRRGHVESMRDVGETVEIALRTDMGLQTILAAKVVNCTGPDMIYRRAGSALCIIFWILVSPCPDSREAAYGPTRMVP